MSSVSDDDDSGPSLKELVTKNLEANGILGKLQAQLRASVFLILEEEFQEKNIPIVNQKTNQVLSTPLGKIAISLVQDFLQCLNLEFTLAVFCPETKSILTEASLNRDHLSKELLCRPSDKYPYLLQLIEDNQNAQNKNVKTNSFIGTKDLQNEKTSKNYLQEEKKQEDKQVIVSLSENVHENKTADPIKTNNLEKKNENSLNSREKQSIENEQSLKKGVNSESGSSVKNSNSTVTSSYSNQSTNNNTLSSLSNNDQQSESSDKSTLTKSSESNKSPISEIEKYSEEDFSSASESKSQTEEESSKLVDKLKTAKNHLKAEEEKSEIEEAIETAEDIEEEISAFDDLLSINSESSNKTKDISVSKEENKLADYEESL